MSYMMFCPRTPALATADDLVLASGEFRLTDSGVRADLRRPLSRLSGHYPWKFLPMGIASLKALVVDNCVATGSVVKRLGLSDDDVTELSQKIGHVAWFIGGDRPVLEHDSDLCDDVGRLLEWGAGLSKRCPYASTARDLMRLPEMGGPELDRYIASMIS